MAGRARPGHLDNLRYHPGMQDFEKLGLFYLGRKYDLARAQPLDTPVLYDSRDLVTHAMCVGMTGSGKTGLCLSLIEEAAIDGVPVIAIDPKGDLGNLLLTFPGLSPQEFRPWIDEDEACRAGVGPDEYAAQLELVCRTAGGHPAGCRAAGRARVEQATSLLSLAGVEDRRRLLNSCAVRRRRRPEREGILGRRACVGNGRGRAGAPAATGRTDPGRNQRHRGRLRSAAGFRARHAPAQAGTGRRAADRARLGSRVGALRAPAFSQTVTSTRPATPRCHHRGSWAAGRLYWRGCLCGATAAG